MYNYQYDSANRLTTVDGVNYTFDDNGNLLSDGTNTYTYDSANRLTTVSGTSSTVNYAYNGLGDRYTQTVNNQATTYVLDLNAGLTQVLDDGTNTYTYGLGRISQQNTATLVTDYFLGDTLGSVRQMTNNAGDITLVNTYEPYGTTLSSAGDSATPYGFTGEYTDATGNIYLRARYYNPNDGRFLSKDTYEGDSQNPITFNKWQYTYSNPINLTDPSGKDPWWCNGDRECINAWLQAISTTSSATPPIPYYVPESSQWNSQNPCGCNVWNFENWETLDGLSYSKWLEALQTYYQYCNTNRNEKNVFWEEESQLSLRLILAHNIIKEFGDMLLYDWGILDEQSEAYGRQYWEHCGPDGCFIKDGIADSRLISFLSGSQSWRDSAGGINDVIIGGFGPGKRQEALELADRIISPSGSDTAWKSGQLPNKPYHYGYISGSYPPSPKWLVEFLKKGSNQGYGSHQYVESYRDPYSNNLLFVLTPNQAEELCGDTICVQMNYNAPVPSWLNK